MHRAEGWVEGSLPKVLDLAKHPNAAIKVSAACTLSREPYPFADIWDPLARVFDAWGLDRCLWGTDWTRVFAVVNYEQAVEPFLRTDRLSNSERAMLGRCLRQGLWLVAEERLGHTDGYCNIRAFNAAGFVLSVAVLPELS